MTDPLGPQPRQRAQRILLFGALVLLAFLAARILGLDPSVRTLRDWGDGFGTVGPVVYALFGVALSCAFVPFPVIAGAAGLIFGVAAGTVISIVIAGLSAVAQMWIGRFLVPRGALGRWDRGVNDFLERRGLMAVLYTRLIPGVPYVPLNYAAGLTRLRSLDMALGTAIAKAPRSYAYAALGGTLGDVSRPETQIAVAILVCTAVAGILVARHQIRSETSARRTERSDGSG
jgi:uncharacterized membrane protein YdjX (TVP38/TMEM64 family)